MDGSSTAEASSSPYASWGTILAICATLLGFLVPLIRLFPPIPPRLSDALAVTHSKLGVVQQQQQQQHGRRRSKAANSPAPRIESLWIYPIKSCRGISVPRARVLPAGLEFDRTFTLAQLRSKSDEDKDDHKWVIITQRQFPRLALVEVEVWQPDLAKQRRRKADGSNSNADSFILVRFPWRETGTWGAFSTILHKLVYGFSSEPSKEFLLPAAFPWEKEAEESEITSRGYTYESVGIWNETATALNMRSEVPEELRVFLGVKNELTLFRVDPSRLREVYRCAPASGEAGYQPVTGFQDAYPLHLIGNESIRDLEGMLRKDDKLSSLDPRRFRANILVDNSPAYDEDSWKEVCFQPAATSSALPSRHHVSCRTVRCKMPNIDQGTAFRHRSEPDRTLRTHRDIDAGAPKYGCLGMQLTPLFDHVDTGGGGGGGGADQLVSSAFSPATMDLESMLEVGMTVEVLERGEHLYIPQ